MRRYNMAQIRENLSEVVSRAAFGGERIVIGRRERDLAAIVSMADLALLESLEDQIDLREARKAEKEPGPHIPLSEVKRRIKNRKAKA
jgi:prevent-host-death family protein